MATALLERINAVLEDLGDRLDDALGAELIAGLSGVVVVLVLVRALVIRSVLGGRKSWAVLPADEFDPRSEDVSRFAFQLVRVRRVMRAWLEGPASAVRIRLVTVPDGRMLYVIEGPQHARLVQRAANYDRVDLRDLDRFDELDLMALSMRFDVPDDPGPGDAGLSRPVRGEPPEPAFDDPEEDLEHHWLKEDRW